jgi:hypothetical protein
VNEQTVFRSDGRNRAYTAIANSLLQDGRLTHETKGLLCELLSRPGDWQITVRGIVATGKSGRDKVYRMLKEAIGFGYIREDRERRADGTLPKSAYVVSDAPEILAEQGCDPLPEIQEVVGDPLPAQPDPAQPDPANPPQQSKEDNKSKTEQSAALAREAFPLSQLREALLAAASGAITSAATAEPQRWLAAGYDLALDILPTIAARSAGRRPGEILSWAYFTPAIAQAKATRLAPVAEGIARAAQRPRSWLAEQEERKRKLNAVLDARIARKEAQGNVYV